MDFEIINDTLSRWREVKENEWYLNQLKQEGGRTYKVLEPSKRSEFYEEDYEKGKDQLSNSVQSLGDSFLVEYDQSQFGEITVEPTSHAEKLLEFDTVEQVINYATIKEIETDEMYGLDARTHKTS